MAEHGNLDDIYRQALREHYEEPHNFGALPGANAVGRASNPTCGDEISVYLRLDAGDARAAAFDGHLERYDACCYEAVAYCINRNYVVARI